MRSDGVFFVVVIQTPEWKFSTSLLLSLSLSQSLSLEALIHVHAPEQLFSSPCLFCEERFYLVSARSAIAPNGATLNTQRTRSNADMDWQEEDAYAGAQVAHGKQVEKMYTGPEHHECKEVLPRQNV